MASARAHPMSYRAVIMLAGSVMLAGSGFPGLFTPGGAFTPVAVGRAELHASERHCACWRVCHGK